VSHLPASPILSGLFLVCICIGADAQAPAVLEGRVSRVKDGDSFVLISHGEEVEARIAEIDAPELAQPFGDGARRALSRRIAGRDVRLEVSAVDAYGRSVGRLRVGNTDVGRELVREGAAWVSRRYADDLELYDLESEARRARRGLWATAEAERTPPWEWRHARAPESPPAAPKPERHLDPRAAECGTKRYCREMTSCEEARFHLEHCGLRRLDGDEDGIPCEDLCRRR
jgi:endonuclease YncB( thermonuclease family)